VLVISARFQVTYAAFVLPSWTHLSVPNVILMSSHAFVYLYDAILFSVQYNKTCLFMQWAVQNQFVSLWIKYELLSEVSIRLELIGTVLLLMLFSAYNTL